MSCPRHDIKSVQPSSCQSAVTLKMGGVPHAPPQLRRGLHFFASEQTELGILF